MSNTDSTSDEHGEYTPQFRLSETECNQIVVALNMYANEVGDKYAEELRDLSDRFAQAYENDEG